MKRLWLSLILFLSVLSVTGCGGDDDTYFANYTPSNTIILNSLEPGQGPTEGGNTVVLSGVRFDAVSDVRFGLAPAQFRVISPERIEAIAPPGSGTVGVRVGNASEASNALSYAYIAVSSTSPVVTSLSPYQGPPAGGNTVILTGSNLIGATAVTFGDTPATNFAVDSSTQITAIAPAGSGTVPVQVTTPNGASISVSYTYTDAPVLLSLSNSSGDPGGGNTIILTGLGFTGATEVRFGANSATFTLNSSVQISAVVPAGSGAVAVTVVSPTGTSNALTYFYTLPSRSL